MKDPVIRTQQRSNMDERHPAICVGLSAGGFYRIVPARHIFASYWNIAAGSIALHSTEFTNCISDVRITARDIDLHNTFASRVHPVWTSAFAFAVDRKEASAVWLT
jgi:hypothetical protein